jgi:hypothetical protein
MKPEVIINILVCPTVTEPAVPFPTVEAMITTLSMVDCPDAVRMDKPPTLLLPTLCQSSVAVPLVARAGTILIVTGSL